MLPALCFYLAHFAQTQAQTAAQAAEPLAQIAVPVAHSRASKLLSLISRDHGLSSALSANSRTEADDEAGVIRVTGTPGDGYGHINVQTDNSVPPCTKGYKPPSQWRPGTDLSDSAIFPARCLSGPPINMRGNKYAPQFGSNSSNGRSYRVSPYDPKTGVVDDSTVGKVRVGQTSGQRHTVFGDDTWQWLLLGPEVGPASTR